MPLLYEQLRTYVVEEIRAGRLGPGDRVPSEAGLSQQFNVSRITSKKALDTLERDGVVVRIRGKGSFVAGRAAGVPHVDGHTIRPDGTAVVAAPDPDPSRSARADRTIDTGTIGFILPDMSDVFGVRMFNAVEERCADRDWQLLIRRTRGHRDLEVAAISRFVRSGVAGLIVFPVHGEYYNDELLRIVLDGFPVVLIDRYLKGIAVGSVATDNHEAARVLTTHLIERGNTRIGFLAPPPERTSSIEDRRRGFTAALREHGLPPDRDAHLLTLASTLPGSRLMLERADDRRRIHAFLDANPDLTAFVACEYTLALILDNVLQERGDEDTRRAVACFDSPEDPLGVYRFTHIRQDQRAMGEAAVDLLIAAIGGDRDPARVDVPFTLVERTATTA